MSTLFRRLRYWLHRNDMEADLAEELEYHRAMLAKDGAPAAAMGNTTLARENARGVWIWPWLESLWQDVAYGIRTMRRQPALTITALIALGSAIGVNTSLFTVFNAFALRPWPVHDPARVVTVSRFTRDGGGDFGIAEYRYLAQNSKSLSGLLVSRNGEHVKIADHPQNLTYVSGNYFQVLGVDMERGRGFLDEEDRTGSPQPVIAISHDLWQERFSADPNIVGRSISLDEIPFTVVGVTPADFTGTNSLRNDIWMPLPARVLLRPNDPSVRGWLTSPQFCCSPVAGRLAPGVSRTQAQAELATLLDQFRTANATGSERANVVLAGTAWMDSPRKKKQVVPMILTLFLAVTLVLLLACANVGNLLLARAAARRREIAVRLSLGGGRFRIVRQLLVESMVLALGAAVLGLGIALLLPPAVMHRIAGDQSFHLTPDSNVLLYTIAVAVLSCLAFGLAPALHGTRGGISAALKSGADFSANTRARLPLRSVLLGVQVAISVVLLVNAGLLVRGLQRAQSIDPGFDVQHTTVLSIDLPASQYTGPRTMALTRDLQSQLNQAGGLPAFALTLNPPLSNSTYMTSFRPDGRPQSPALHIYENDISGGYADALGMHLIAGRNFVPEDTARKVLMINEAAARRWWPGESPVGKTVIANEEPRQIVGILSDTYTNDLSGIEAFLYYPIEGRGSVPFVLVRDRGTASTERIAALVKQLEPRAQVRAEALIESFQRKLQPSLYGSEMAGFLGLLALAIASVGMSGVFSYVVGQRTREIGMRMALGAQPRQIIRLVLGSTVWTLACGLGCGVAASAGISTLLAHTLPGIQPLDAVAYAGVLLLLSVAVALASAVPVRRATKVDPMRALRCD